MDSGIKCEKDSIAKMAEMKEVAKNPYDLLILNIVPDPNAPPPKGNKAPAEHIAVTHVFNKGDCEKEFEGQDLGGIPANYYKFMQLTKEDEKACFYALLYFTFELKDRGTQEKLLAISWAPDSAPMKLKMRFSSTFKTLMNKAPKINGKLESHDQDDVNYNNVISNVFS